MPRRKHPTEALLKELREVYERHNWSGTAIGIAMTPTSHNNFSAAHGIAPAHNLDGCPPGKTPQPYKYQLPDGTWVFGTICV